MTDLQQLQFVAQKQRLMGSLWTFLTEGLGYPLEPVHQALCEFVEHGGNRKMVLMPRFSWKTNCITIGYSLYRILKDPNVRILLDSELYKNAKRFLLSLKQYLEVHPTCQGYFGNWVPKRDEGKWNDTEIVVTPRTTFAKEATVTVSGLDVDMTSAHFNLAILDDVVSHNNTQTAEQIQKVIDHFKLMHNLLDPQGGEAIVIGTRWHFSDLYQHILEEGRYRVFQREAVEHCRIGVTDHAYTLAGTPRFPSLLPLTFLEEQLNQQGKAIWFCQYQNQPVDDETATFKRAWVKTWATVPSGLTIYVTIDPAISEEATADESAIVTNGVTPDGEWYVLECRSGRWNPTELTRQVFQVVALYHPHQVGLETHGFQQTLAYVFRDEMARRRAYFPILELTADSRQSKARRIEGLVPLFETGRVWLPPLGDTPLTHGSAETLTWQLLQYPKCAHDDCLDALAHQLQLVSPGRRASVPKAVPAPMTWGWYEDRLARVERARGRLGNEGWTEAELWRTLR